MDKYSSTAVLLSLSVFLLQLGQGEHTETTESVGTAAATDENEDVYTGWSTAAPLNTDVWDAVPTADTSSDPPAHKSESTSTHSPIVHNGTKSTQSTDLSDIHFKPQHKIDFDKSVFHQQVPPNDHYDTNALEQFIKGDPAEPLQREQIQGKEPSSISPSPYTSSRPSIPTSKHSEISEGTASNVNGSRNLLHETTDAQSTHITDKSEINGTIQKGNTQDSSDLGKGYTSSVQEDDVVTDTPKSPLETNPDTVKNTDRENAVRKQDEFNKLKSQVHSFTQDDDGEYDYGEPVLDEVELYDSDQEDTQGNNAKKVTNNQTTLESEDDTVPEANSPNESDEDLTDEVNLSNGTTDSDDATDWYYNSDEDYDDDEEYYTDEDYEEEKNDSHENRGNTSSGTKWNHVKEKERHIPVRADSAYTSVLEDPGPLGEIKTLTHGESLTRHQPVPKQSGHDSSLPILVFYTWIGVVTVMIIGAFIALKQRHRISNFVWDHRTGYRKSETVFATEEGRNLLLHQHV